MQRLLISKILRLVATELAQGKLSTIHEVYIVSSCQSFVNDSDLVSAIARKIRRRRTAPVFIGELNGTPSARVVQPTATGRQASKLLL